MTILLSTFLCPPFYSSEVSLHCFSDTVVVSGTLLEIKQSAWLPDERSWNSDSKQTKHSTRKKQNLKTTCILVQKCIFYSDYKVSDLQRENFPWVLFSKQERTVWKKVDFRLSCSVDHLRLQGWCIYISHLTHPHLKPFPWSLPVYVRFMKYAFLHLILLPWNNLIFTSFFPEFIFLESELIWIMTLYNFRKMYKWIVLFSLCYDPRVFLRFVVWPRENFRLGA